MTKSILVIKRNGSKEAFSEFKIAKVVMAAGLSQNQATELAKVVMDSLKRNTVSSLEIRDLVSKELHKTDEYAANLFDWYQKVKEDGTP